MKIGIFDHLEPSIDSDPFGSWHQFQLFGNRMPTGRSILKYLCCSRRSEISGGTGDTGDTGTKTLGLNRLSVPSFVSPLSAVLQTGDSSIAAAQRRIARL